MIPVSACYKFLLSDIGQNQKIIMPIAMFGRFELFDDLFANRYALKHKHIDVRAPYGDYRADVFSYTDQNAEIKALLVEPFPDLPNYGSIRLNRASDDLIIFRNSSELLYEVLVVPGYKSQQAETTTAIIASGISQIFDQQLVKLKVKNEI